MSKYKPVRMPKEALDNFKKKQKRMEEMLSKITGKQKQVPMTRVLKISSKEPIYLSDEELIKHLKEKNK